MTPYYRYAGTKNAKQIGLGVDACAARLLRFAYAESRLMFLQAAHIISTPSRDLKALLSRYQYEDAQHADRLKRRLTELRVSHRRAYEETDPDLKIFFDEAVHARGTAELLAALTLVIKPAMIEAYERYAEQTNGLADYETVRALKEIISEEKECLALLRAAYADAGLASREISAAEAWASDLGDLLAAAGGIDGGGDVDPEALTNNRGLTSYVIPHEQAWDDTFPRIWDNQRVEEDQVAPRLAQMICTRLGETTIAEALSFVLCETVGQPWSFYVDISRHMWDEMRHSLFGEAAAEDVFERLSSIGLVSGKDYLADTAFAADPAGMLVAKGGSSHGGVDVGYSAFLSNAREASWRAQDIVWGRYEVRSHAQDLWSVPDRVGHHRA